MTKYICLVFLSYLAAACRWDAVKSEEANETKTFITHDTIPEVRDSVNRSPVASYASPGNKLKVDVYETRQTF